MAYPTNDNVLVVYNSSTTANANFSDTTQSKDIADYAESTFAGCHKIGIPIVDGIRSGTYGEDVARADYETYIRDVIRQAIIDGGWTIYYIVLCKGIPHRIPGSGTTYSSVDSELCTYEDDFNGVYDPYTLVYNMGGNPYLIYGYWAQPELYSLFEPNKFTSSSPYPFTDSGISCLVTRLDGYTVAQVKAMIDKSAAPYTGGDAWYILDSDPYKGYDGMGIANDRLLLDSLNVRFDKTTDFITTNPAGFLMAYQGHGIHHSDYPPSGATYILDDFAFNLRNGAIWSAYESFSCWSFGKHDGSATGRNGQGQISDWISIGGSGAAGNAYEPARSGIPLEETFMWMYSRGLPLADAFYMSISWLSWTSVVIGWPLMRINTIVNHAPLEPKNVRLVREADRLRVRWAPNQELDLDAYTLLWSDTSVPPYTNTVNLGNDVIEYSITPFNVYRTYYVSLSATDDGGLEGLAHEDVSGGVNVGRLHGQGTALVGGDISGNTRGSLSIDIQTGRASGVTKVASGTSSISIGNDCEAIVSDSIAIGHTAAASISGTAIGKNVTVSGYYGVGIAESSTVSASYGIAIGYDAVSSAQNAIAIGPATDATATEAVAIGEGAQALGVNTGAFGTRAEARIANTVNMCGPHINRKDDGESAGNAFKSFCGVEVVLMTKEVDLEVVADQTITLPAGCKFWIDEIGLITTSIDTLTVQPTIRFGITGTLAKHYSATITTALTAVGKREIETPLVPEDGETSLTAGVTVAATATTALGRFYWKGILCEDE